ncbi:MAG: DEAD/DEAH box helicase [Planctomycetales bacterium]|nr:DEAD/DEAH box helicase [Planctomycetales bacterium]NIM09890.1 DEAD/DEAH box helicase [Planctomycetales bacterium]NIN09329.1 DEAD/DEAH box helicase [Planctomycetales bacterium]NIN78437.1 DEAD/DEAH box helicase [Planctomycetales bacterium]NIO35628.1 DEAD/DEAH box helicase [Planctomycetales bacterium]
MAKESDPSFTDVKFGDLGLSDTTLAALSAAEYLEPTAVQAGLIPRALESADVIGQARTGTGKTAAFAIPILELLNPDRRHAPQALVLVPTRELAVQVRDETVKLSKGRRTRTVAVYGGKPIRGQIEKLQRGADIVVGTPGRLLDHIGRRSLKLKDLKIVVLDEADRMLDIGFRPDIEKILRHCPRQRQTLLLSATVPPPVQRLARRYMHEPESLNFSPREISGHTIEQFYFTVDHDRKFELLDRLLQRENPKQAIVFCRTKRGTDRVALRLKKRHSDVGCIHGDLPQQARDRVMAQFRAGTVRILVATDVVGRGIDVTGISHIINYDIPQFCDDYVHRVGRTGRMSKLGVAEGVAFTFVTPEEGSELTRIEMRIDKLLGRDEIEGFATQAQTAAAAAEASATGGAEPEKPPGEKKPPPPGKRPPRRIRRAL